MPVQDELRDWRHMAWDDRLISRHRAADMAGSWEMKIEYQPADAGHEAWPMIFLRCMSCDGNILKLPSDGKLINVDGIISAVVRHMVMSKHGYALSGGNGGSEN